jgi:hypothetical protein
MPPTMLMDALQAVRRRVKLLGVVYGVGIAVAVAIALLLTTILFDYLLNLPAWPRLVLSVVALACVGYVLARWVYAPAKAKLSLGDIAGRLERAFPQFDDRLRSTVDFATGGANSGRAFGSEVMKDRVMGETAKLASQLDLGSAVVLKPVWYATAAASAALLLAMLLAILASPVYTRIAISRLINPFAAPSWPKRVQIEMMGNVPVRIPVGQRFDLKMKLAKGDRSSTKAKIFYQLDGGPVQQEYMTRGADGVYATSLDAKSDPTKSASIMKVWMTAGDDQKDLTPITVLPRLAIARVEAVVTPPKYVGDAVKPVVVNLAEGPAITAAGSEIALRVAFNKSLAANTPIEVKPLADGAKAPAITWTRAADSTLIGKWIAYESMRFHVVATDTDGFQNSGLEEYETIIRPDQNPTVQIENPRRNEERTPVAIVPLQGVAEDDYGIGTMNLIVDRLGDKKHWEVNLVTNAAPAEGVTWNRVEASGDRMRFRGNYTWDLAKLDSAGLKPGDVLEYQLQVTDNYNLNNQTHAPVPSGKLRITIVSQEQFTDIITNELRQAASAIKDIHSRQSRTKEETGQLAKDTESKPAFDAGDKAVAERLGNQQGTSASQAKQVAGKLESVAERMTENKSPANDLKQLATDVKDLLNNTAENPMKDAAAQIAMAPQQAPTPRAETMKSAAGNQQRAMDQLQNAMDRMGSVGSLEQTMDKLRDLLKEQQRVNKETADVGAKNLGKKPEQMSPEDQAKLAKAAADQQMLSTKTDKLIAEMTKTAEQMKKSDPSSAEALKQAAQTGTSQAVPSNQSKAAAAAKQNQQASAQAAQKQAELGLQMMLNDLREAERRKLEELSKKLAEIQQQLANLIRRQSGHNLDNLGLQGKTVDKLDTKLATDLLALAERAKNALPAQPQLPQLTNSQEQTERNTRDIAQVVEKLPSGAEPSSNLTKAASKMERAIVALRAKDLTGAYEPPQVEALAALLDAKKIIDEQKNAIDQKKDEQQKEAVRQAYIKIKADQEKLNAETTRIDKAAGGKVGGADANLKREDTIRLGQMPGEQNKLAVRTQELEEALAAVNSVVYIWANKDIVSSMNSVKDDLAKPTTGVPTQAEETRIVEQLDAMIKNLEVHLLDRRFEAKGGGGGGQCGPKLPTEAELRLLKSLQEAVNHSTKKIDAEAVKDKPKLLALGGRQGELRNLLDQVLQKSSGGEAKLRAEPDNKEQLPEEANKDDVEQQELQQAMAGEDPTAEQMEKDIMMVGDRMARSRQRLALNNDPGKTTQVIQQRILRDLDVLIEQSRKQACPGGQPQPGQKPGQRMAKPGERQVADVIGNGKKPGSKSSKGASPAQQSSAPGQEATQTDLSQEIKESASEWGKISPRTRNAVIEGSSEQVIEKYRRYVEDYYKGVAVKGAEHE